MLMQQQTPEVFTVERRCYGGTQHHGAWLAPKVGPLGISSRAISQTLQSKTDMWLDYKIDVKIRIYPRTRTWEVETKPTVSTMILRASSYIPPSVQDRNLISRSLGKGGYECKSRGPEERKRKFSHDADIMVAAVFAIAKQQRLWGRSFAVNFVGTVKEVLGSCHSLGITVDGTRAIKLQQAITDGKFVVPEDQCAEAIESFLDDEGLPRPHLCKETFMSDEEKAQMKEKSTTKMKAVRYREPILPQA